MFTRYNFVIPVAFGTCQLPLNFGAGKTLNVEHEGFVRSIKVVGDLVLLMKFGLPGL